MRKLTAVPAALLGLALVTVVVAAATAQARTEKTQATNITLSGWSAGKTEDDLLQSMVDTFNRTHPTIHVDYSVINGDYTPAMTARFAAQNPPDVFYVDSARLSTWAKQGVLQPLNSYIKATKFDTSKFYPGLLDAFKVGKTIYGFPKDWSPLAVEINTAMFRAAGIKRAPRTWAELTADAQKLASSNAVPGGKPICLNPDWARMLAFIYQNKGSLANVQSPAVAAAVNYYAGLVKKGLAATPTQLGVGWPGEALGKEKAAIIFEGNWLLPYMPMNFPQMQIRRCSDGEGEGQRQPGVHGLVLDGEGFDHKQAAWTLLSWLTGKRGMTLWMSKGLALPSRYRCRGGRWPEGVPCGWAVLARLGVPQLRCHLHDHEQRPAGSDQRHDDDIADACGRRGVLEGLDGRSLDPSARR